MARGRKASAKKASPPPPKKVTENEDDNNSDSSEDSVSSGFLTKTLLENTQEDEITETAPAQDADTEPEEQSTLKRARKDAKPKSKVSKTPPSPGSRIVNSRQSTKKRKPSASPKPSKKPKQHPTARKSTAPPARRQSFLPANTSPGRKSANTSPGRKSPTAARAPHSDKAVAEKAKKNNPDANGSFRS